MDDKKIIENSVNFMDVDEGWTLVNDMGLEIENVSCQTDFASKSAQPDAIVNDSNDKVEIKNILLDEKSSQSLDVNKELDNNTYLLPTTSTPLSNNCCNEKISLELSSLTPQILIDDNTIDSDRCRNNFSDDSLSENEYDSDLSVIDEVQINSRHLKFIDTNDKENADSHNTDFTQGSSHAELPSDWVLRSAPQGLHNYVHQPQPLLDRHLTLIALLAATTVFGLGVGHFWGSSLLFRIGQWTPSFRSSSHSASEAKHLLYAEKNKCLSEHTSFHQQISDLNIKLKNCESSLTHERMRIDLQQFCSKADKPLAQISSFSNYKIADEQVSDRAVSSGAVTKLILREQMFRLQLEQIRNRTNNCETLLDNSYTREYYTMNRFLQCQQQMQKSNIENCNERTLWVLMQDWLLSLKNTSSDFYWWTYDLFARRKHELPVYVVDQLESFWNNNEDYSWCSVAAKYWEDSRKEFANVWHNAKTYSRDFIYHGQPLVDELTSTIKDKFVKHLVDYSHKFVETSRPIIEDFNNIMSSSIKQYAHTFGNQYDKLKNEFEHKWHTYLNQHLLYKPYSGGDDDVNQDANSEPLKPMDAKDYSDLQKNSYRLRQVLKNSGWFSNIISHKVASVYFDRLKRLYKSRDLSGNEVLWFQCQVHWWHFMSTTDRRSFYAPVTCENTLYHWQLRSSETLHLAISSDIALSAVVANAKDKSYIDQTKSQSDDNAGMNVREQLRKESSKQDWILERKWQRANLRAANQKQLDRTLDWVFKRAKVRNDIRGRRVIYSSADSGQNWQRVIKSEPFAGKHSTFENNRKRRNDYFD